MSTHPMEVRLPRDTGAGNRAIVASHSYRSEQREAKVPKLPRLCATEHRW